MSCRLFGSGARGLAFGMPCLPSAKRARFCLLPLVLFACTNGGASEDGESGESSGTESGETESSEGESGETEESGETGAVDLFDGDLEIVQYETQPMVADVIVHLTAEGAGAQLEVTHPFDPGVRIARLEGVGDDMNPHYRLRGMAPATAHGVDVVATLDGNEDAQQVQFTTGAPLPGFVPSFDVTVSGDPEPVYRLMDWSNFGGMGAPPVGLMQLDPQGVTRWYIGRTNTMFGPAATMAGVELLDDGTVLFQQNGINEIVDELGETVASYDPADVPGDSLYHHDVTYLPNGNVLALGYEYTDAEYPPPEGTLHICGDHLTEFNPQGEVVWRWSSFEHLDTSRRREGFDAAFPPLIDPDTNEPSKDWTHGNAVVYNPDDDSILLSLRHQDWIIKIDHETGDVLWRLGDEGDFALTEGSWFFHQHSPQWQPDGSLLLYDNGNGNPYVTVDGWFSRAVRYSIDEMTMEAAVVWEDDAEDFLSEAMGDADRMPGGNILVADSAIGLNEGGQFIHATIRELDPEATPQRQWSFTTEVGRFIYRAVPTERLVGEAAP